ncbi:hypothetical protein [Flavobacterium sp. GT3R68]|uniref:hypothetical protein n=1 Tax=Flavobacterium sp. GT3R68 TaxID=2594437 RepID=UPI000F8692F6|nr:hypothetical protein [Flavobacterium sp. GT3R68]RTY89143.1 hypothetical protein EKL32_24280 [Flavobacterium sp. GSN2]TRW90059.1 hypothetical protein FNW07_11410 [Flavobacterium sp. GT3R68]
MLKLGGYINILIAIGHIVGLLWADKMFEVTGIGSEMTELAQNHSSLPYLLTVFVSIIFFIFGLYGLSADNKFRNLPFLKPVIFLIAAIYLLRGLGELIVDNIQGTNSITETIYSLFALIIGLLFLIGGLKKWNLATNKEITNP